MTVITLSLYGRHAALGSRGAGGRWPLLSCAALGCVILALIGWRFAWQLGSMASRQEVPWPRAAAGSNASSGDLDFQAEIDLYGNEVSDALATYGIDSSGGEYELHSPQTEPLRAAPPKS